ncbi:BrnT family toxin [Maridesulfovibrio ferrireducens]|uniref:BrnT family toxin n=1 Tax=Maridesulfovibrio ferrireducens TaxID=246191 RepID=UPI001A29F6C5|nr:BrnT family toxin [Maridesulfovibrio ferrireducens]MBI9110061.1 BrnT family toxin [Maridesulfovibrio ferrireducens]
MQFEYDNNKSVSNLEKHGIDFKQAQALWNDPNLLEIPARTQDEPRIFFIGIINGKHWSAVTTPRNGVIRIISVRRSRKKEVELYES